MSNDLTPVILGVVGAVLSLLFSYVPAIKAWYAAQSNQGLIMVGFVLLVSLAYFGLSCTSLAAGLGITVACTQAGAIQMIYGFIGCLAGNQLAYLTTGTTPAAATKK